MEQQSRECISARVSTFAEEQEHSLLGQVEHFTELIESNPKAVLVGVYADKRSGKNTRGRPQFMQMVKAVRRGEIDKIWTKSVARFGRNMLETIQYVREFRDLGVTIIFEQENIDTSNLGCEFMLYVYSNVAEKELDSMSENVKWSARKRFANGSVELGRIYGFDVTADGLSINETEAAIVREIFARYIAGEGLGAIAKKLNERGIKKKYGLKFWRSTDVRRILENEKHIGDAILQKTYMEKFKPVKNDGVAVPMKYIAGNHDAIVDSDLFMQVQARLEERSAAVPKRTPYPQSPFTGKIKCKECGMGYLRRINNRNTPYQKWLWSCSNYVQNGRKYCGGHNIREKDLQEAFFSTYCEAVNFVDKTAPTSILSDRFKELLAQEQDLSALHVKGYISREAYDEQQAALLVHIKEAEAALLLAVKRAGRTKLHAAEKYSDSLGAYLESVEIDGFNITFTFTNNAIISRIFNNDTNRKETWSRKLGRIS